METIGENGERFVQEREQTRSAELDQLHVQQRAMEALRDLLSRTENEGLAVLTWTIASSPSTSALVAVCDTGDAGERRRGFEEWCDALGATRLADEVSGQGSTRLRARVVDTYLDLSIDLVADV
ncbi:hypothetical protein ACBI99_35470 [Nonomuraea sp. ATR24]|uniref:hypothetical protein n=1 Tax=Nonomuraea sp. ATR24 TaxID=1676744 RepID=UPI0035C111CA